MAPDPPWRTPRFARQSRSAAVGRSRPRPNVAGGRQCSRDCTRGTVHSGRTGTGVRHDHEMWARSSFHAASTIISAVRQRYPSGAVADDGHYSKDRETTAGPAEPNRRARRDGGSTARRCPHAHEGTDMLGSTDHSTPWRQRPHPVYYHKRHSAAGSGGFPCCTGPAGDTDSMGSAPVGPMCRLQVLLGHVRAPESARHWAAPAGRTPQRCRWADRWAAR